MKKVFLALLLSTAICSGVVAETKEASLQEGTKAVEAKTIEVKNEKKVEKAPEKTDETSKDLSKEEKIKEVVAYNVMSADVDYDGDIELVKNEKGYLVQIPQGVLQTDNSSVPAFSFPLIKVDAKDDYTHYQFTLDKLINVFPYLNSLLEQNQGKYTSMSYSNKLIPEIGLTEQEKLTLNNISVPFEKIYQLAIKKVSLDNHQTMLSTDDFSQNASIVLDDVSLSSPSFASGAKKITMGVNVPHLKSSISSLESFQKIDSFQFTSSMDDFSYKSMVDQYPYSLKANVRTTLDEKKTPCVDKDDADLSLHFNTLVDNIVFEGVEDVPTSVSIDFIMDGFTSNKSIMLSQKTEELNLMAASFAQKKDLTPEEKQLFAQKDLEVKLLTIDFLQNLLITFNQVRIVGKNYKIDLKGKINPALREVSATLVVSNFDYLVPEPKKIDKVACDKLMTDFSEQLTKEESGEKMNEQLEEFNKLYEKNCITENRLLSFLRQFKSTARSVKLDGDDALEFDISFKGNVNTINGQPLKLGF